MDGYYIMTNWGPMKVVRGGSSSEITSGAPEDMNTFLEVSAKYKELQDKLNSFEGVSTGNWLVKKVSTLPLASVDTCNAIYKDKSGNIYATINNGTESSPSYEWASLGKSEESDPVWASERNNYYTRDDIDSKGFLTKHQSLAGKQNKLTAALLANINSDHSLYLTEESDPIFTASPAAGIKESDIKKWNSKGTSNFSGNYKDLTNKPTIPSKTSELTNDAGFISDISGKLDKLTDTLLENINTAKVQSDWEATEGLATILNKPDIFTKEEVQSLYDLLASRISSLEASSKTSSDNNGILGYYAIVPGSTIAERKANLKEGTNITFTALTKNITEITTGTDQEGMVSVLYNKWIPRFNACDSTANKWQDSDTSLTNTLEDPLLIDGVNYIVWYNTGATISANSKFKIILP